MKKLKNCDPIFLDMQYCYNNKIFGWLKANAGVKNLDWKHTMFHDYYSMLRIKDDATACQFLLLHGEEHTRVYNVCKRNWPLEMDEAIHYG